MRTFLTYIHRRNDTGAVFYVGKGSHRRAHEERGRSAYWTRVVAKHGYSVEIVAPWRTEQEAFDHEVFLIVCFRSMGAPLVNLTNGGDGMSGHRHSPETKARMRAKALGRSRGAKTREKIRQYRLGIPVSAEAKALIGAFHSARVRPASEYENQRVTNATAETKARRSQAMKTSLARPEVKAKMLASRKTSEAFAKAMARRRKPVVCLDTGVEFVSATQAASSLNLQTANVCNVCNGRAKTAGGLTFRWLDATRAHRTSP